MGNNIEILAPAGAFESVKAAVCTGASAVYIGAQRFSARASAANFSDEEIISAARYCHERSVKLYLAINTLIRDDELQSALKTVSLACTAGVDALIVQDLGLAAIIREVAPDMPLHASTQMSVHTPKGAKLLHSLGFKRVVLARELSRDEIAEIVASCPIETEVFVHGALCMSVSGQCEFSALLGGRSGNRGRCAQPCRLPFALDNGKGNGSALSLKDLSLLEHIKELEEIGVTSAKIEGRMKRPEYVAAATDACISALNGVLDESKKNRLESVFSRSGFTDGYYFGKIDSNMFGVRSKENVTAADSKLFTQLKALYKDERQHLPITFKFTLKHGENAVLEAHSGSYNASAQGDIPEAAFKVALSEEKAAAQLKKTGGTPFALDEIKLEIEDGLAFPLSSINAMRRDCLNSLTEQYAKVIDKPFKPLRLDKTKPYKTDTKQKIRARFTSCDIPNELLGCELIYVPLFSPNKNIKQLLERGFNIGVEIPRMIFGKEKAVIKRLSEIKSLGVNHTLASNLGAVEPAKNAGLTVHGSFALNAFNTQTLNKLEQIGIADIELSQELTAEQMKSLGGNIKRGAVSCGRLPLMVTRACPAKNGGQDCKSCNKQRYIIDRKRNRLPLKCDGFSTEVLNPVPTYAQHIFENADYLDFITLRFSLEGKDEIIKLYSAVRNSCHLSGDYTNGLYKRGVI
ncbi:MULTISPECIES: U32 family peptidase [unclassified Ruminococcus]|uniref:U32 family peptidase n=1 Tax=unclassified Ruminococcus TaxID=2608920 RepID=UPI00210CD495|nr:MULTISPECIES: U32 family peptidase [unclassified Ruminococcus]MCQ4021458.1 U32 family peptidase [Ruminococcus sp. zg-924]MCQ4113903.1 U32 family peptidase [Ruminococcus sp. zg-921]